MNHRLLRLTLAALVATALMILLPAAGAAQAAKPNIVFVLIDDLGWTDLGCMGSSFYETPNIDRLAAQGMKFTQAYAACPVCSPTRASLLTGKVPARIPITNFIAGARQGKLLPADYLKALPLEETTVATPLKQAGYKTAYFGKWHLGGEPALPDKFGFDLNVGGYGAGSPGSYFSPYKNRKLPDGPQGESLDERLTQEAIKFIDGAAAEKKPFLVYLAHHTVHTPLQARPEVVAKYKAKAEKLGEPSTPRFGNEHANQVRQVQDHAVYAAMVESMDDSVGALMKKLDDLKLTADTVFIFTSDNGGLSTSEGMPTSNLPLRAGKGWLYEGGIRVPLIVRYPQLVKAGTTCDVPVSSSDFYPTWLELAGLPLMPKQHLDGTSFLPLLKGEKTLERGPLFWHYPHYSNQGGTPGSAVRDGDLKLIEFFEDGHLELYNLKEDISEKTDLSAKMPEKTAELKKKLDAHRKAIDARYPTPNPNWDPAKGTVQPPKKPKK